MISPLISIILNLSLLHIPSVLLLILPITGVSSCNITFCDCVSHFNSFNSLLGFPKREVFVSSCLISSGFCFLENQLVFSFFFGVKLRHKCDYGSHAGKFNVKG